MLAFDANRFSFLAYRWVVDTVNRVRVAVSASLVAGAPPAAIASVDRLTGRSTSVGSTTAASTFAVCCTVCSEDTYPVRVVGLWSQVEITRTLREGLAPGLRTGSRGGSGGSSSGLLTPVTLSPALSPQGLPTVVDSVKTVWPRNPFDPLPPGEGCVGGVLEYTLRDGASGAVVGLPPVTSSTAGLPMHFLVAIGKLVARPHESSPRLRTGHACERCGLGTQVSLVPLLTDESFMCSVVPAVIHSPQSPWLLPTSCPRVASGTSHPNNGAAAAC
jgi:hypothetical protein